MAYLSRRAFDTNILRYLESDLGNQDIERYDANHLDLQMIGKLMWLFFVFVELGALVSGHVI